MQCLNHVREQTRGPMACGHPEDVVVFPNQFRLIELGEGNIVADIPAFRARNVCNICEAIGQETGVQSQERRASFTAEEIGKNLIRKEPSLGPMACGHHATVYVNPAGSRCIWFSPLEYCADEVAPRARWVCQDCRNKKLRAEGFHIPEQIEEKQAASSDEKALSMSIPEQIPSTESGIQIKGKARRRSRRK